MVPLLPLLSCESSVSVKENPDRKKTLYPAYGQKDFVAVNLELLDNKSSIQL